MSESVRSLFGGAITCPISTRFQDVSNLRPVPDHQECFADGDADRSFVFEIVVRADGDLMAG